MRQTRSVFQDTMELRFTEKIEELTEREVVAFMSASHQDPDLSLEVFVLLPEPEPEPQPEAVGAAE